MKYGKTIRYLKERIESYEMTKYDIENDIKELKEMLKELETRR